jgi:hypothetical protein
VGWELDIRTLPSQVWGFRDSGNSERIGGAHRLEKVVNKDLSAILRLRLLSTLQQPASLYCQIIQRQPQLRNCRADLPDALQCSLAEIVESSEHFEVRFRL